jgi:hypothetical protein
MSALDVKKHGGLDRSWRLSCRALLSVFLLAVAIQLNAKHVERGGWRDNALPKFFDAPGALVATMGSKVRPAPSELLECGCKAGAVVHDRPVIREDDGNAIGRLRVIACRPHGSECLELVGFVFGEFARAPEAAISLVFGDLDADALAVTAATSGAMSLGNRIKSGAELAVGGAASAELVSDGEFAGDGVGGGHGIVWFVVGSRVVQLRTLYTVAVYPQEKSTLFLCSPKTRSFSPLNA